MRAVKAVLVMAGNLKRTQEGDEKSVLIKAIVDSNVPKFLRDDELLFNAIVQDLFPSLTIQGSLDEALKTKVIAKVLPGLNLTSQHAQIEKVMQLQNSLNVRHGVMVIGETKTGKSTII